MVVIDRTDAGEKRMPREVSRNLQSMPHVSMTQGKFADVLRRLLLIGS